MKKILIISLAFLSASTSFSQSNDQIQNKKGVDILPVKGEFAVGMDASPFLNYIGDIFGSNSSNTALNGNKFMTNYFGSNTIYGKYMISNNNAIRLNMRITDTHSNNKYNVYDDLVNSPDSTVLDSRKGYNNAFNIGAGYEFRRGKNRLRGIYGADVFYMTSKNSTTYEYGNAFSTGNQTPTSMYDSNGSFQGGSGTSIAERRTENKSGRTHGVGLRGFVGIEYYIAPKICIGSEFGYGFSYSNTSESKIITERFSPTATDADGNVGTVVTRETTTAGSSNFGFNTDNFNGALYLMFYF